MTAWICATCGVQHEDTEEPPAECAICVDERQWVPADGQRWTDLAQLAGSGHVSDLRELEPGLLGIGVDPKVGIGQRALLVCTSEGNVLWDPPGFLDAAAIERVRELGGLAAVTASHPHFYGVMAEWSTLFDAQLLVPTDDRAWVRRSSPRPRLWRGTRALVGGLTLIQCGGHFDGSAVLHWPAGADGRGALLVGDTMTVVLDRAHLSFMRSYPNHIPLPESAVRAMTDAVAAYPFDRVYGAWWGRVIQAGGEAALARSARRYVGWLSGSQAT
jgi:hypothetical protein